MLLHSFYYFPLSLSLSRVNTVWHRRVQKKNNSKVTSVCRNSAVITDGGCTAAYGRHSATGVVGCRFLCHTSNEIRSAATAGDIAISLWRCVTDLCICGPPSRRLLLLLLLLDDDAVIYDDDDTRASQSSGAFSLTEAADHRKAKAKAKTYNTCIAPQAAYRSSSGAVHVTDRADVQPIGRRLSLRPQTDI